jgi:hypothetical protein
MSASCVSTFKACPTRFRLKYREGLRKVEDTDAQRIGTNWHALHEVYADHLAENEDQGGAIVTALQHLDRCYAETPLPPAKTPEEWDVERQILMQSFLGYLWHWQDDPVDVICSEVAFELPLHAPRTGLPLPLHEVKRVGRIDQVVRWRGMVGALERKSTSKTIDPGNGGYWDRVQKDTQVSMYALAFRDILQAHGLSYFGLDSDDPCMKLPWGNTLYDVWHRPTKKPRKLTQKDTAEFLETGEYHGESFEVEVDDSAAVPRVFVDGVEPEVHEGKRGFAIRETPAMFGARLFADIQLQPGYYFQRREVARTDRDLAKFRKELFNIYEAQRLYSKTGCWFENEQQCRATFHCPYIPICYGEGADQVCEEGSTPAGFERIFPDPVQAEQGEQE